MTFAIFSDGKKDEDFGGLGLYLDLVRIGYVELPEEKGCSSEDCNDVEVKEPLSPPEIMIGCHKTSDNPTQRGFTSGVFDEVAYWGHWLNDTVKPYFLGGYSKNQSQCSQITKKVSVQFQLYQVCPLFENYSKCRI